MIDLENNNLPYEKITIRSDVHLICDYCGIKFIRVKKSIGRLNAIINKDSCGSKECKNKKKEEVALKQYGVKNVFQTDAVKEKSKQTCIDKYGTGSYFSSKDFQDKKKETMLERYGVEHTLQSEEFQERYKKTCMDKYGVDNAAKVEEFQDKRIETIEKGDGWNTLIKKRKETSLEKYGVENYMQTEEGQQKKKQTCIEKYGVDHSSKTSENRDKARETVLEKYGVDNYSKTDECKKRLAKIFQEKYGVPNVLCLEKNQKKYGKAQKEIQNWLNSFGFDFKSNYSILGNKQLDMYDESLKLAIEYNGNFWHCEASPTPRNKYYHYNKYINCLKQNIMLITIFEDEWKKHKDKCMSIIKTKIGKPDTILYARKCSLKSIDKKEFSEFCLNNHLLGKSKFGIIFFALKSGNDIVGVMSLGKHHRGGEALVLDRLCFKKNVLVVGGAEKLFKACKSWAIALGHHKIISWSDNRWSQGTVYEKLGFKLEKNLNVDYSYINLKNPIQRLSKQSQKKSNTECPVDVTESEWCIQRGLSRIWDCGKKRWSINL